MPATALNYNKSHELITQQTYYNCGPGSCELVLDARGIHVAEQELAQTMGTTTDGTPSIDTIAMGLNTYDPESQYQSMWMPNDPPTQQEIDLMRERIFRTIAWGRGCVVNFVVPPSNYPRAVPKSDPSLPGAEGISPNYAGGVVYHYCSLLGADDSDDTVLIVDPGFQPSQYWVKVSQLASMVTPHGIVWSSGAPELAPPSVPMVSAPKPHGTEGGLPGPVTELSLAEKLSYAMDEGLTIEQYGQILPHVMASLEASECNTRERVAMWMAQIGHESQGLLHFEELGGPEYFAQYNDRADLGNRPGTNDGVVYHGRGPIMVTGLSNYQQVSQWAHSKGYVPTPTFFVDDPDKLATWEFGFQSCNWYWLVARGSAINEAADRGDVAEATRLVNGGYTNLEDRQARYARALTVADAFLQPAAAPDHSMVIVPPAPPANKPETCLTGRPHHHSENPPTDQQILDIRAEGLCTQALVFAIAEKLGVDARAVYDAARASF